MSLWGIGNLILLIVIVPVLVSLLNTLLGAVESIRGAADDALAGGVALIVSSSSMSCPLPSASHNSFFLLKIRENHHAKTFKICK
jgi:hypothetical protein